MASSLATLLTILLLLETIPSALAQLTRARVGLTRFDQLTRLGTLEGRNLGLVTLLGVLHTFGAVGVLVGLRQPMVGVAGAALEALIYLATLLRQVQLGDRGQPLFAYSLFTAMAASVLVVDAVRA
jgi:hypothetical protein